MPSIKSEKKLQLNAFVKVATPDKLRVSHADGGWWVRSGEHVLMRPCGSTAFSSINETFGVLASAGIRCAVVEWDGVHAVTDKGRILSDSHIVDRIVHLEEK